VLLQASVTKRWFDRRLVSPEDRLGSKGRYFAFGEDRTNVSPSNPTNDQEKFATYTRDSATGLDYANQRYFSSVTGRFTQPDPFSGSANATFSQSWNRYSYALNDPANHNDPTGLFCSAYEPDCMELPAQDPGLEGGSGGPPAAPNPEQPSPTPGGGSGDSDPSGLGANYGLDDAGAEAKRALVKPDCRDLFGLGAEPATLLQEGLNGNGSTLYIGFSNLAPLIGPDKVVAQTTYANPTLLLGGYIIPSATITINTNNEWFKGWSADRSVFGNYSDLQFRAETLIHELVHVYERVDGLGGTHITPHPEDNVPFDKEIFSKCFN
jgi:RHS repeat-associated protein